MSDSGSSQFPRGGIPNLGAQPNAHVKAEPVRLIGVPNDLQNVERPVRLRGEVIQRRANNVVKVRTERGDVEVQYPKNQTPPREGDTVRVEVPAGKPPRQALIRASSATTIRTENQPSAQQSTQKSTSQSVNQGESQNQSRIQATPIDVRVTPPNARMRGSINLGALPPAPGFSFSPMAPSAPVPLNQPLQLQALSQAKAQDILAQFNARLLTIESTLPLSFSAIEQTLQPSLTSKSLPSPVSKVSALMPTLDISLPRLQISSITSGPPILNFTAPDTVTDPMDIVAFSDVKTVKRNLIPNAVSSALPALSAKLSSSHTLTAPPQSLDFTLMQFATAQNSTKIIKIDAFRNIQSIVFKSENTETGKDVLKQSFFEPRLDSAQSTPLHYKNQLFKDNILSYQLALRVSALTDNNLPMLTTGQLSDGTARSFLLHTPAPHVIPGQILQIEPIGGTVPAPPGMGFTSLGPVHVGSILQGGFWESMQQLQSAIQTISPTVAQSFSSVIPNAANPAQIMPAALFFIAAVRGGDLGSWLGEKALDALKRTDRGQGALNRLGQESALLSRMSDGVSPDWRAFSLPLYNQDEIHKMALYYRREQSSEDDNAPQKGREQTRFIFDLDLSQIGHVQLDGLFRMRENQPRLDVILRTPSAFSQHMQAEMKQLYTRTIRHSQIDGELSFQNDPKSWVTIDIENLDQETVVV